MRSTLVLLALLASCPAFCTIIDRIAVIVGNSPVKDSDIERNLRITDFLNNEPVDLGSVSRKNAAKRLIDQVFLRREIRIGDYPPATPEEAGQQLDALKKNRFKTNTAYLEALRRYRLTDADLRIEFQWQLTVLRFIDARFKPAVLVTDEEIESYYRAHQAALARAHPGKASPDDQRENIRDTITGEKVNKQFFSWLDEQRQSIKLQFREEGLS
jgi:hypothetical protein